MKKALCKSLFKNTFYCPFGENSILVPWFKEFRKNLKHMKCIYMLMNVYMGF